MHSLAIGTALRRAKESPIKSPCPLGVSQTRAPDHCLFLFLVFPYQTMPPTGHQQDTNRTPTGHQQDKPTGQTNSTHLVFVFLLFLFLSFAAGAGLQGPVLCRLAPREPRGPGPGPGPADRGARAEATGRKLRCRLQLGGWRVFFFSFREPHQNSKCVGFWKALGFPWT